MNSIFAFIITLGILIFVHEFGHFIFAKLFGVKVLKFSLGFGPKLVGKKIGDTEYQVSALPLGGYVKMLGEQNEEESEEADSDRSFAKKPVWQRFTIVLAGPLFNLLFALFIFFMIYLAVGLPKLIDSTTLAGVSPGSPAEAAGLKAGDVVLSIDGVETKSWEDISELIKNSQGRTLTIVVRRNGTTLTMTGTPVEDDLKNIFGEVVEKRYQLGISRPDQVVYEKVPVGEAFLAGLHQTWSFIYLTVVGIIKIIQRVVPASELSGPFRIAQMAGQQMEAGWLYLFNFMGLLSVSLGVINLFPVPLLDGGHLVVYAMEGVRRKPLSAQAQEILQQIGLVLLVTLMIFVFYNDIVNIFFKG